MDREKTKAKLRIQINRKPSRGNRVPFTIELCKKKVLLHFAATISVEDAPKKLSVVEPPAGFGDSPDHKPGPNAEADGLAGFHEVVVDQPLPQDEHLLMASEEIVSAPTLHITQAFQPGE